MTRASKLILTFLAVLLLAVAGVILDQRGAGPRNTAPPASTGSPASSSPASPANDPFGGLK